MHRELLFGSRALQFWFPDHTRKPNDTDVINFNPPIKSSKAYEFHTNPVYQYILDHNKHPSVVDPDFLYTAKVSHAAWDVHWDKTMHDIMFLKRKNCKLDITLYNLLYKEWEIVHRAKRVKLDVKNEEFFTNKVIRKYDHDWLHSFLAFGSEPLHNRIRLNLDSPLCSEKLWTVLSREDKVKCALEEIYVVAVERFIPVYPPRIAKTKAMKILITSMTKGWFNLFLIENFEELLRYDSTHWFNKIKELP